MFTTIVVGTDGSAGAEAAFSMAAQLAERDDARLVVVHVQEFLVGGRGGVYPAHVDEDRIKARIRGAVEELNARGVKTDLEIDEIPYGGPAHVIADVAQKAGADLIVVGSKGHNVMSQVVLGSVPTRLLHVAHRPVLVVPAS